MRVGVIGTGHVGLITCASFAAVGHDVVGTDADRTKIDSLARGDMPFHEPGVASAISEGMAAGRLTFRLRTAEAVRDADILFVCVGTPPRATGEANLVAVEQAVREALRHAQAGARHRREVYGTRRHGGSVDPHGRPWSVPIWPVDRHRVESRVPARGARLEDAMHPERILVGAARSLRSRPMRELYAPFTGRGSRLIETDIRTAELAKHACNAFLALKISYANALARLCERADADVDAVTDVMGADSRIGPAFLRAGLGYGGYCFPKDLVAFDHLGSDLSDTTSRCCARSRASTTRPWSDLDKVRDALWNLDDKSVALLGLAFKPGIDDVTDAPALMLAERLRGARRRGRGIRSLPSEALVRAQPELEIANTGVRGSPRCELRGAVHRVG